MSVRTCRAPGCTYPAMKGRQRCGWHVLAGLSLATQEEAARRRLTAAESAEGYAYRARVAAALIVDGCRWCAGCQSVVPLFYCSGSRCKACARRSTRAGHVERTYGLAGDLEAAMRSWQHNRCWVCGQRARKRQLAVDHDHRTNEVRGLLCTRCNEDLARILGDPDAARRLLLYVEKAPLQRYLDDEASPFDYLPANQGTAVS